MKIKKLAPQNQLPDVCNTHYMLTIKGVLDCNVPEFDPAKYQGLKKNCGRPPRKK